MDERALRAKVEAAWEVWNAAFNRGDAEALAACYTEPTTFLPPSHDVIETRAGVAKLFGGFFANGVTGHKLDLINAFADGDTIVTAARWSSEGKNADGAPATFGGISTQVLARQPDGTLKVRLHTFN